MTYRNILVNQDGLVGIVQLNRPRVLNSETMTELVNGLGELDKDQNIRAIILKEYVGHRFSMIPFEGTEDFYVHLGFSRVSRWEMRW